MAHKISIPLVLLALLSGILSSQVQQTPPQPPAIKSIGLVRGKVYDGSKLPHHCMVSIEATRNVYFKLTHNQQIIKGGLLKRGPNLVDFNVQGIFETPGIYRYTLALKENGVTSSRPIIIESIVTSTQMPEQTLKAARQNAGRVTMFVADQLVASAEKKHRMRLTTKTAGEPRELDYGQYDAVSGRYQSLDRAGFSPLMLVGMAYKKIKKARDREKAKVEIKTHRAIYFDYLDDSTERKKHPRRVSLKITAVGIH